MKTLSDWVEDLKIWDIPVLQRSIRELAKLSSRTKNTASEISDVVLYDPLLTLKVQCLVNGMSRSRLSSEISTVEHAVVMLGIGPFFNRLANLNPFENSDFFAMSVFLHGKPIGMFYADSKPSGSELNDQRYVEFKQLCLRASQGLAHLSKK